MSDAMFASAEIVPVTEQVGTMADSDGQALDYLTALVTLKYSTTQFERFVVESLEPNVQFQVLDNMKFWWKNSDDTLEQLAKQESPGEQIRGLAYVVRFNNIFQPPLDPGTFDIQKYLALIGQVNSAAFPIKMLRKTYQPEQVLLLPSPVSYFEMPQSDEAHAETLATHKWDYTLKYSIKENIHGWNAYKRRSSDTFEQIYKKVAGAPVLYNNYPLDKAITDGGDGLIADLLPTFLKT
jgi:hypothetical protein